MHLASYIAKLRSYPTIYGFLFHTSLESRRCCSTSVPKALIRRTLALRRKIHNLRTEKLRVQLNSFYCELGYLISSLTRKYRWSRYRVRLEVVVDVGRVSRVRGLECTRYRHRVLRHCASSASDLDVGARDVELRFAARVVNTQLLNAKKVIASRDAFWDRSRVFLCPSLISTYRLPTQLSTHAS